VNRRQLLRALGLGVVTVTTLPLLQACGGSTPASKPAETKPAETPKPAADTKPAAAAPATPPQSAPAAAAPTAAAGPAAAAAKPGFKPRGEATGPFPSRPIELVVPFAPGGGSGITGETINKVFTDENLMPQPMAISYKPGAGGMIGWAYLTQNRGEPHVIATATSSLITGPLVTETPLTYKDLTPIALMAVDGLLIVTGAEGPYKSWDDLVSAAKASPKTINTGGTSASGSDAMAFSVLQKQQGFEITYIPFNSGGEVNAALLGNHVALASGNPNELLPQIQAGKMRPMLALTGKRIPALADTPTAIEKGVNLNLESGRGIVGPPDMPADARQIWVDAFKKATESAGWKKYAGDNQMVIQFLGGDEYGEYFEEQTEMYTRIIKEMGIGRS